MAKKAKKKSDKKLLNKKEVIKSDKKSKKKKKIKEKKQNITPNIVEEVKPVEEKVAYISTLNPVTPVETNTVLENFSRLVSQLDTIINEPLLFKGNYIHQAELDALDEIKRSQPVTLMDLANNLGITKGTVAKTTNKLSHKNLISKERSEKNPRENSIKLTEEGEAVLKLEPNWTARKKEPVIQTLEKMNEQELAFFNSVIERILVNTIK